MPARNAETTIAASVRSVLDQTFRDWELIVVDDGSTDRTVEVVRDTVAEDPRVTILVGPARGEPAARNLALAHARGEWVAMLDADDIAVPDRLDRQLDFVTTRPGIFGIAARPWLFVTDGVALGVAATQEPTDCAQLEALKQRRRLFVFCHPTFLMRRETLLSIGGYDEDYMQACDTELVNRAVYAHGLTFLLQPEPLIWYRIAAKGMSSTALPLQRRVLRHLEDRNHRWSRGEAPQSLSDALAEPIASRTRLRWWRHDVGAVLYRRAGISVGRSRHGSAAALLLVASVLHPRYTFRKLSTQRPWRFVARRDRVGEPRRA
jgi:glycosyltransferase involved in cell wall biosynthesis